MNIITRRAALAGATAVAATAALPAMAASAAAGNDAELLAMIEEFTAVNGRLATAEEACMEATVEISGLPQIRLLHPKVLIKISRRERDEGVSRPEYREADLWLERCDHLEADLEVREARIAETPAVTLAGLLEKLRLHVDGPAGRTMLHSALADLGRMAG